MFLGGFAQNKRANTSSFFNTNSNKSKTDHSSGHKGGFLLNYVGNDSLSENSSSKPQVDLEKYKSLLDSQSSDDNNNDNDIKSNEIESKSSSDTSNSLLLTKSINKPKNDSKPEKLKSLDLLSNLPFQESNTSKTNSILPTNGNVPLFHQEISFSNSEPSQFNQPNLSFSQNPQEKQIEDLKKQMELQQKQIQFLLKQQQQQQQLNIFQPISTVPSNITPPLTNNIVNNIVPSLNNGIPNSIVPSLNNNLPSNISPVSNNTISNSIVPSFNNNSVPNNIILTKNSSNIPDILANDQKMQEPQSQRLVPNFSLNFSSNLIKTETKASASSKITTFDFSKGDAPSFNVKFNFGTGKQFISKTKPNKPFLMYNFNNFNFSKSKSDSVNKKGGNDYTDSFLLKQPHESNKSNSNEKNILQVQNIKLYILNSNNKRKKKFTCIGPGRISITVINDVRRIIVMHNYTDKCILNTRIFPNISPILKEKYIQIIGQNFVINNDYNDDDDNEDEDNENNEDNNINNVCDIKDSDDVKNENEKEGYLSIYRICFPTPEKAKEFYQCVSLIK